MASFILKRSSFRTASFEYTTLCWYCTTAIVDNVTISAITTISSMIVNPSADRTLPVTVLRSIKCSPIERRVDVKDILPTPMRGIRIVLIGPEAPVRAFCHRIDRNLPQELQLAPGRVVGRGDTLHQLFEVGRVSFAARLDLE